jgi:hypothetical protein
MSRVFGRIAALALLTAGAGAFLAQPLFAGPADARSQARKQPITPPSTIELFNGKDLSGLYTHLREQGNSDPQKVFRVEDGMLRATGEGFGYVATEQAYRDYHLTVEYRWGERTDGSGYVRNAGVLLHGTGPDGSAGRGAWMASLEVQLAQGCEGDLIVVRGEDEDGETIPIDIASYVRYAEDGKTRWDPDGKEVAYSGKQFWWSRHQPFFKEKLDTRGKNDVASKLGQWTKVEAICRGDRVTVKINGVTVNEAVDVWPTSGKILLQCEGNEIFYRNWTLRPLDE